jgi:hypothetical protein
LQYTACLAAANKGLFQAKIEKNELAKDNFRDFFTILGIYEQRVFIQKKRVVQKYHSLGVITSG